MKFLNKKTGVILIPNSKFVEEQMKKSDIYEELKEKNSEETKKKSNKKSE